MSEKEIIDTLLRNYQYIVATRTFHNELLRTAAIVSDLQEKVIGGGLTIHYGEVQNLYNQVATISALIQYLCLNDFLQENVLIEYTTAAIEPIIKEFNKQIEQKRKEFYEQFNDGGAV